MARGPLVPEHCPECGAPLLAGGTCRENLYALLALESAIPGGPGAAPHFHAVAAYGLQHPGSMNYTAETLAGLRVALADELDGGATVDDIRRRMRCDSEGAARITRRPGDAHVPWHRGAWPMTVADVLPVEPNAAAYADRLLRWARSVCDVLVAGDW